jgi:hypothetical protein
MRSIVADVQAAAEQISTALRSTGYRADFSADSLWDLDSFFDEHTKNGTPKPGGLLADQTGARVFALGGYLGETLRRHLGGQWSGDDADPEGEISIMLRLQDGGACFPVQRVMKRLSQGSAESLIAYGLALGLQPGPRPLSSKLRRIIRFLS